jgi:4a-hydroxytetrahydrobiopterin dehydratase
MAMLRRVVSEAVSPIGWRYVLGVAETCVRVDSLLQGIDVAAAAVVACGSDADGHLRLDVRPDGVLLSLQTWAEGELTPLDCDLAARMSTALSDVGFFTGPGALRALQSVEIAVDALDIPTIRPFWKAALAYVDEGPGPEDALIDPVGQGPAVWFQQMDEPREQRNRIHFDISLPHDEAEARMAEIVAAGGRMIYDAEAPAFWVFADAEGNEVCITTWQGRDPA